MILSVKLWLLLTLTAVLFSLGLLVGWKLWHPKPAVVQVYHPEIRQKDGSVALEVKPDAAAKPLMVLPKGAVVDRQGNITVSPVQPVAIPQIPGSSGMALPPQPSLQPVKSPCPPVKIDWTLVTMPDQQQRMIFRSEGSEITGVDIPVRNAAPVKVLRNAAGISYNPWDKTYGVFAERDYGPIRVGVEALQKKIPTIPGVFTSTFQDSMIISTRQSEIPGKTTWTANLKLALRF